MIDVLEMIRSAEQRLQPAFARLEDMALANEKRVLDANPCAVLLRATWMYDMPMYGVPNRPNFIVSMLRQSRGTWRFPPRDGPTTPWRPR